MTITKAENRAHKLKRLGHHLIDKLSKGNQDRKNSLYKLIYKQMGLEPWEERKAHFSSSIDPKVLQKMVLILEEENFKREMNIIRQQIKNEKKKNRETNAHAFELLIKWRLAQVKEKNDNAVPWYKQIYVFLKRTMTQPKEQTICPKCDRPYTFTRCRVTDSKGGSHCLSCGVEMERAKRI